MECAQDDPDSFMAAFFSEEFVEEDEAFLGYAFWCYQAVALLRYGLLDVLEIRSAERFAEAFGLKVVDLVITEEAVLIQVA